tara:strand:- start:588 stop:812 length:225 start_codon:yes stop_codon:yes gene_type:complete
MAFFGPAVTIAGNGSVYKAGLSYVSNQAVTKITGNTPIENIQKMLQPKKDENKIVRSVKNKIVENRRIQKYLNQ